LKDDSKEIASEIKGLRNFDKISAILDLSNDKDEIVENQIAKLAEPIIKSKHLINKNKERRTKALGKRLNLLL
jgi:hypothetical protein